MYSQCPECFARFRVSADDLRSAGGTVRCGRCGSAFNALAWLSDTVPPSLGDGRGMRASGGLTGGEEPAPEVAVTEFHFTADDIDRVFADAGGWRSPRVVETPDVDAAGLEDFGAEPPLVVVSEEQPFEDITLEGERISIESILAVTEDEHSADEGVPDLDSTDEFRVLRDVPDSAYPEDEDEESPAEAARLEDNSALDMLLEGEPAEASPPEPVPAPAAEPARIPSAAQSGQESLDMRRWRRATDGPAPDFELDRADARPARWTLAWSLACMVLALALLAQLVHHFRQDLVRHPQLGPVVTDAYARLGLPLAPNWDLAAFDLKQWGSPGDAGPGGRLTVRASIRNRAAFAQPHPVLRLELDDRYGDAVAVRDFEPAEYLKNPADASRMLAPGAGTDAELVVIEPDRDAVGYQLDVCLRESAALLRCAQHTG